MTLKNLIGQKFGKLTVIERAEDHISKSGRKNVMWKCLCDCNTFTISYKSSLLEGTTKSCGCLRLEPINDFKPGDKFTRLTLISYSNGKWLCQCDCGNTLSKKSGALISGNTKSCGCLKADGPSEETIDKRTNAQRKFTPQITTARYLWRNIYLYQDRRLGFKDEEIISFEDFLKLSQKKCYYCDIEPFKIFNIFLKKNGARSKSIDEGNFTYNGLDRVDNLKGHSLSNSVTCCIICNKAKRDRTLQDFKKWITNLKIINKDYDIYIINKENSKYYESSVSLAWYGYNDGDITKKEFECLSQYNCHYCDTIPNNIRNYVLKNKNLPIKYADGAEFKYNGLDRVDNNKGHNKDNCVPCCYDCNFAKSDLKLSEFHDWILRIKANINNW